MTDFQSQLDGELERRGLNKSDVEDEANHKNTKKSFSFVAFSKALFTGVLVFIGFVAWAWFSGQSFQEKMIKNLASKTAIIEMPKELQQLRVQDVQPVLSMPPIDVTEDPKPFVEVPHDEVSAQANTQSSMPNEQVSMPEANGAGLVPALVPGLYQSVSGGIVPVIRREDGLTSFEAYKRPFNKSANKPLLSIIITDVGLSNKVTQSLIENFTSDVTLAFSPYAANVKQLTKAARDKGHEVWLNLPMETKNYPVDDSGPNAILRSTSVEKNNSRLITNLSATQGYVGIITQKDHAFKMSDAETNEAIKSIFQRGLAVIDSNVTQDSFVRALAYKKDYPHGKNNFWLDDDLTPLALNQKLRQMKDFGEASGSVTLMLRPYPSSLKAVQKFLNSAAADTFQLAPASAMVRYGG